jgi:hypothetical protein
VRRRVFLGSGVALAGSAVGLGITLRLRGAERARFLTAFRAPRGRGKLMSLASIGSAEDQRAFAAAQTAILKGDDEDLALRMLLVHIEVIADNDIVRSMTGDRPKLAPPWLAVTDGEVPVLGEQMPLDRGRFREDIELFLRQAVRLDVAWLEQRAALAERDDPDLVRRIRSGIQDGSLTTDLARQAPAVVALEARRSTTDNFTRQRLMGLLVPPRPRRKVKATSMIDCGMAAMIMTPLGARFAATFVRRVRSDRKGGSKT